MFAVHFELDGSSFASYSNFLFCAFYERAWKGIIFWNPDRMWNRKYSTGHTAHAYV